VRHFAYFPLSHDSDSDVAEAALDALRMLKARLQ
jgi:hypothetical protein